MARRFPWSRPAVTQAQAVASHQGGRDRPGPVPARPLPVATLVAITTGATVAVGVIFAAWPQLDLAIAQMFWRVEGGFVGDGAVGRVLRQLFEAVPFLLLAGLTVCYALRRFGGARLWAPNGPGLLMLAASLALGPGLLVNVGLKDHSHRPRPVQVTEFGGPYAFRPFYRFDGACRRNCSFVSGEGSSAAWTLAPALLAPPALRALALTAALLFAGATGALRMAFGGHFASDSLFAALFSWLVILGCWSAATGLTGRSPGADQPRGPPGPPFRPPQEVDGSPRADHH